MSKALTVHPVALLFPDLLPADFDALLEDIRQHGVKVPILVHRGQILDGRHRYRACGELGVTCPVVEWNGTDPWLEVQSRNLVRRHLAKEQIYAIRLLAARRFPSLAAPIQAAKAEARQRRAQARGQPRGTKALVRAQDQKGKSADIIGGLFGVSGATVKRVERLARVAPHLLSKVATGELSAKKALQETLIKKAFVKRHARPQAPTPDSAAFVVEAAVRRLRELIKEEWAAWPREYRGEFLYGVQQQLRELIYQHTVAAGTGPSSVSRTIDQRADQRAG